MGSSIVRCVDCCWAGRGGQGVLLQWLQVTAVPLGVFLLGACTWGVIESLVPWRSLTGHRQGHSTSNAIDHELPTIDSSRDGSGEQIVSNFINRVLHECTNFAGLVTSCTPSYSSIKFYSASTRDHLKFVDSNCIHAGMFDPIHLFANSILYLYLIPQSLELMWDANSLISTCKLWF